MKVKDIMTSDVKSCAEDTNLATAAKIMWEGDCGAVPVIDKQQKVLGMITDRDICIAAATRSRAEWEIPVGEVISKTLHACAPGDDVRAALVTMKTEKVRRLPVVGTDGRLMGIVSIHDIALHTGSRGKGTGIPPEEVLDTFTWISAPSPRRVTVPA